MKKIFCLFTVIVALLTAIPANAAGKVTDKLVDKSATVLFIADNNLFDIDRVSDSSFRFTVMDNIMMRQVEFGETVSVSYITRSGDAVIINGKNAKGEKVMFMVKYEGGKLYFTYTNDATRKTFLNEFVNYVMFSKKWTIEDGGQLEYEDNAASAMRFFYRWCGKFNSSLLLQ